MVAHQYQLVTGALKRMSVESCFMTVWPFIAEQCAGCQSSVGAVSRLPPALRLRKITTATAANRFLREEYVQASNRRFSLNASERGTAFVPARRKELELVFSLQHKRVVARDNTSQLW